VDVAVPVVAWLAVMLGDGLGVVLPAAGARWWSAWVWPVCGVLPVLAAFACVADAIDGWDAVVVTLAMLMAWASARGRCAPIYGVGVIDW
jgi:hypothetical protein